jgi:hypothetical protein
MEEIFSSNSIKVIQKELDVSLVNNSSLKSNDEFDFYFDIQQLSTWIQEKKFKRVILEQTKRNFKSH